MCSPAWLAMWCVYKCVCVCPVYVSVCVCVSVHGWLCGVYISVCVCLLGVVVICTCTLMSGFSTYLESQTMQFLCWLGMQ